MKNIIYLFLVLLLPFLVCGQSDTNEKEEELIPLEHPESFASLLKQFEGKVVYIDILASWCGPCMEELENSKKLDGYFKENDVVKLYITIDASKDIGKCYSLLHAKSLTGYFTMLHPAVGEHTQFFNDMADLFFSSGQIEIPRYAIVNKEGKIVNKSASRPSSPGRLKQQLAKHL